MMRIFITFYIILGTSLLARAQNLYDFVLTDGWKASKVFHSNEDTNIIVGLVSDPNPSAFHRFHFTTLDKNNDVIKIDTFNLPWSNFVSYQSPFGIQKDDGDIFINGHFSTQNGNYSGGVFRFKDGLELEQFDSVPYGGTSSVFSYISRKNTQTDIFYGGYQDGSRGNSVQTYLTLIRNEDTTISTFNNGNLLSEYGDCITLPRQLISSNDGGYLLVNTLKPVSWAEREAYQGLIIKVDSLGDELWRLPIWEDSTTVYDLLVAPLANGNYLAVYQDKWYQPNKSPWGNHIADANPNSVTWLVEFNSNGEIIKKWNLRENLEKVLGKRRYLNGYSNLHIEENGDLVFVGYSRDNGKYGYDVGFSLKLDKNGNFKWYRQYEVTVAGPYNSGEENIFLYGISKLRNGGYALCGEYRSHPSDSFPSGCQKGVVLFVDSFGCMEPGCQKNDNIGVAELQAAKSLFSVYPNPSSSEFHILNTKSQTPNRLEVYDAYGRLVYAPKIVTKVLNVSHLTPNIYYLKLFRSDGFYETHKIIIQ